MGKQTIFGSVKEWLAGKCWKYFLKFNNLTEDEYFRQIKEQESRTDESRPVEKLVMPKITEVIKALLNVMDIQEKRMNEEFHLSAEAFKPIWDEAKNDAQKLLNSNFSA